MIPSLRKLHSQIWFSIAIILPILFILAIWVMPQQVDKNDFKDYTPLETKVFSTTKVFFRYNILTNTDNTDKQLEVIYNKPLPMTLSVYLIDGYALDIVRLEDIQHAIFLGNLNQGKTLFSLTDADILLPSTIIIYDNIKNKTVEILNVKL